MNRIVDIDVEGRTARVEPGVIRDDLNRALEPHGLLFGPDTSTSNRCMLGGMIGNNSCGVHSIAYGTTRDHLAEIDVVLADGSRHTLRPTDRSGWEALKADGSLLGAGVRALDHIVTANADAIHTAYPRDDIVRRNTGYPLDDLAATWLGHDSTRSPDLARFFCGTEGTLGMVAEATVTLDALPRERLLIAAHFASIDESMRATVEAVRHEPHAVELMDKRILDLAALNLEQGRNRWFIEGEPGAILAIEFAGDDPRHLAARADSLVASLRAAELGYAFPIIPPDRHQSVWDLRKAGLGVLMGMPGDVKPITIVEDTAVAVDDLPGFIRDFGRVMADHAAECVYYAHASVGEIHLRPELNPKLPADVERAKSIASAVADLVNRYNGSLSGEHGDGRLRGPYVEAALGSQVYGWLKEVKGAFDPQGLFNPGAILDARPMDEDWRFDADYRNVDVPTEFAYEEALGFQRAVERCNGAGVCRRPAEAGGTMCPSYMATREERESTRGRANLFRRLIQAGPDALFGSEELRAALDLCLSCKGCKSDCPASVDMATLKAEFLQGHMDRNGVSSRSRAFADVTRVGRLVHGIPFAPGVVNAVQTWSISRWLQEQLLGVSRRRTLPFFSNATAHRALADRTVAEVVDPLGKVCLFVDELTDSYGGGDAWAAAGLLEQGGYRVIAPRLSPSGRTYLSKGFVREARGHIEANINTLHPLLDQVDAIVGIEPSAVLTMLDEALDLPRDPDMRRKAREIAEKVMLVSDFVARAARADRWRAEWVDDECHILLHGHCHQKAQVGVEGMREALALPPNYTVELIPSGCCGMAGSFGFEKEHYELSMEIGELVLFPAVRAAPESTLVVAPGHSCRDQIRDGTGRFASTPVGILWQALKSTALIRC